MVKSVLMGLKFGVVRPHSGLFSELRFISNGVTIEMLNVISRNTQGCCQTTR